MTLFTKIINGEIPSYKIYEDEYTYAFLDINPVNPGHTLIIPKVEVDYFIDLPEPYYSRVFTNAKLISQAIQKATNCLRVCTWIEGFAVPHMHYHVCPFYEKEGEFWTRRGVATTPESLKEMQEKIVTELKIKNDEMNTENWVN